MSSRIERESAKTDFLTQHIINMVLAPAELGHTINLNFESAIFDE